MRPELKIILRQYNINTNLNDDAAYKADVFLEAVACVDGCLQTKIIKKFGVQTVKYMWRVSARKGQQ